MPTSTADRSTTARGSGRGWRHAPIRVVAAAVGGLLVGLVFPPWSLSWLAPLGIAMFLVAVRGARATIASMAGAAFGVAYLGLVLWWLSASIAPAAWAALAVVQAGWFVGLGALLPSLMRSRWWPLTVAVVWTAVELIRSSWPLGGLPWGRLGYAALDTPWSALLPQVGVTGVTFLACLLGALLALSALQLRSSAPTVVALAPLALLAAPLALPTPSDASTTERTATVGIVQGGVPGSGNRLLDHHREVTQDHVDETARMIARNPDADLDLVVWPENSTAVDPARDTAAGAAIEATVRLLEPPLLAGSITVDNDGFARNQGILWDEDGPGDRYTKQHLVPFGEYVPWRPIATRISARVADITRDLTPGAPNGPLAIDDLTVAVGICFDVAYDDVIVRQVRRGAELVVVQTSNAMFVGTSQPEQQWAVTRARALETGRAIVVASINGISGAIGPDGLVIERLDALSTSSAVVDVPLTARTTLASRATPWLQRAVLITALAIITAVGCTYLRACLKNARPRRDPAQRQATVSMTPTPAASHRFRSSRSRRSRLS